jgi:hypothetical protein
MLRPTPACCAQRPNDLEARLLTAANFPPRAINLGVISMACVHDLCWRHDLYASGLSNAAAQAKSLPQVNCVRTRCPTATKQQHLRQHHQLLRDSSSTAPFACGYCCWSGVLVRRVSARSVRSYRLDRQEDGLNTAHNRLYNLHCAYLIGAFSSELCCGCVMGTVTCQATARSAH